MATGLKMTSASATTLVSSRINWRMGVMGNSLTGILASAAGVRMCHTSPRQTMTSGTLFSMCQPIQ